MPKYQFTEHVYERYIVVFEADSLEHAQEIMDDVMSIDDLPNSERFFRKGETEWETPIEPAKED